MGDMVLNENEYVRFDRNFWCASGVGVGVAQGRLAWHTMALWFQRHFGTLSH